MPVSELTLRARFAFPVDSPPIESASVRIAGERIIDVGPAEPHADIDLGNAAILPGLVNAHTHLELSSHRARELAGRDFAHWLAGVMIKRAAQSSEQIVHAVDRGIDASLSAGTTLIGDVSTSGRSWKRLSRSPLRAVVFAELIGLKSARAVETAQAARQFLDWVGPRADAARHAGVTTAPPDQFATGFVFSDGARIDPLPPAVAKARRLSPSVSPHAPYSTHVLLYDLAALWGRQNAAPICTHLAETSDELRLLTKRDGPLRDFLISIGAWQDDWGPAGPNPTDYVQSGDTCQANWLLAHGNYLDDQEITRLAQSAASGGPARSVAFCPRTHAYFGHGPHPYAKMLEAGLTVCLGTDSLASTPNLSVLDEMRFLRLRDSTLQSATILAMGTIAGACALRREHECGSLTPGKYADLAIVQLPDRTASDPHELLLKSAEPVLRTMIGGRFVFQRR